MCEIVGCCGKRLQLWHLQMVVGIAVILLSISKVYYSTVVSIASELECNTLSRGRRQEKKGDKGKRKILF